ncbi:unnamed protein product [Medioppia subpectinata]|uniref:Uncharacterized protein n=1 Tax=Medioppia subpectinata TaxID=1979941 RepID=A0A7R9PWJ8_9ACAR|nr:unnamed protein product [Medioppia subpectinata]CAG2103844.1 unnamed protein product [Medioppia subpectinata]
MINHLMQTLFLVSIYINGPNIAFCVPSYQDIQLAFDGLTNPINYKSWIRPPVATLRPDGTVDTSPDITAPLFVNVSIDLYNYATVDEITSEYTFHLFIDLEWFDPRLRFSIQNKHNTRNKDEAIIEGGQYHIQRIWYPSVFIPNNQDPGSFDYDSQSANLLKIRSNGLVWLRKRKLLRVYCNMDFHLFPFDQQICSLHLESSISTTTILKLRWNSMKSFSKSDSFHTIGFGLEDYETSVGEQTYSKNNTFSRVSLKFTLVREWAHYMFLFYLPTGIIVIASWATFWLEITSPPARVSIGVTTMLALVTTFTTTKSHLPQVSYWNALDIWNMVCIVFIFGSLVEFACVNYIFNTEKRKKKNKKLKRKRQQSVLKANEIKANNQSMKASSRPQLETIYSQTINTFSQLNKDFSDLTIRRKNTVNSPDEELRKTPALDSKPRLSLVGIDIRRQMTDNKEEFNRNNSPVRKISLRPRTQSAVQIVDSVCYKLSPQELANEIDCKCRRVFPICFVLFNLLYWTILQIRF